MINQYKDFKEWLTICQETLRKKYRNNLTLDAKSWKVLFDENLSPVNAICIMEDMKVMDFVYHYHHVTEYRFRKLLI
jgi:hypothetical protein